MEPARKAGACRYNGISTRTLAGMEKQTPSKISQIGRRPTPSSIDIADGSSGQSSIVVATPSKPGLGYCHLRNQAIYDHTHRAPGN
jgi:hypothetical protein